MKLRSASLSITTPSQAKSGKSSAAESRLVKKEISKFEKQLERAEVEIASLVKAQGDLAFDHEKLAKVMEELAAAKAKKDVIEEAWLSAITTLEELGE